jgi:hypothetical protein
MDGLVTFAKGGDDTFMTSISYPRGIHVRQSSRDQSVNSSSSSSSRSHRRGPSASSVDFVLSEECFKYWQDELNNLQPRYPAAKQ